MTQNVKWEKNTQKITVEVKVNFEIYIADLEATTCIEAKLFMFRCVNSAALPLVRCWSIRRPRRVASWVNYSSRRTESSSQHFASDLSLLKANAPWWENKRCSDSNTWPMDPEASVLPTKPQRPTFAWRALPYVKLRLLNNCAWTYLYPFGLCRCARKKGRKEEKSQEVYISRPLAGGFQLNLANVFVSGT